MTRAIPFWTGSFFVLQFFIDLQLIWFLFYLFVAWTTYNTTVEHEIFAACNFRGFSLRNFAAFYVLVFWELILIYCVSSFLFRNPCKFDRFAKFANIIRARKFHVLQYMTKITCGEQQFVVGFFSAAINFTLYSMRYRETQSIVKFHRNLQHQIVFHIPTDRSMSNKSFHRFLLRQRSKNSSSIAVDWSWCFGSLCSYLSVAAYSLAS